MATILLRSFQMCVDGRAQQILHSGSIYKIKPAISGFENAASRKRSMTSCVRLPSISPKLLKANLVESDVRAAPTITRDRRTLPLTEVAGFCFHRFADLRIFRPCIGDSTVKRTMACSLSSGASSPNLYRVTRR